MKSSSTPPASSDHIEPTLSLSQRSENKELLPLKDQAKKPTIRSVFETNKLSEALTGRSSTAPTEPVSLLPLMVNSSASKPATKATWVAYHKQALQNNGCFIITRQMNFDDACQWLASAPVGIREIKLNKLALDGVQCIALIDTFKSHPALSSLDCADMSISLDGMQAMANILRDHPGLTTFRLYGSGIGSAGVRLCAEALADNTTLISLDLGGADCDEYGAAALGAALKTNRTLRSLSLVYNSLGDEGTTLLVAGLQANTTLTSLNLGLNNIGEEGAQDLADLLRASSGLTTLGLRGNEIGPAGAACLARGLERNTRLTEIILSANDIGDDGGAAPGTKRLLKVRNNSAAGCCEPLRTLS